MSPDRKARDPLVEQTILDCETFRPESLHSGICHRINPLSGVRHCNAWRVKNFQSFRHPVILHTGKTSCEKRLQPFLAGERFVVRISNANIVGEAGDDAIDIQSRKQRSYSSKAPRTVASVRSFNDISPSFYPGVSVCSATGWVSRSERRGPFLTADDPGISVCRTITSDQPEMNVASSEARKTMLLAIS